ncbi:MAG: hypothetical protein B7Y83_08370 [Flavobacteriales bacterium 32-34-25]|nr:MAG: hypothetical protein B7Y83_08370 [Flavobacteriales bacterium 32-34-25]
MKSKRSTLNKLEGIGLLLILLSFFLQLFQNDLQSSLNDTQYYQLHDKLDTLWRIIQNDYSQNHPESGVSGTINFEEYSNNWKIYSEEIKELKTWEKSIIFFSKINIILFVIGSVFLIIPKFIEEK